MPLGYQPVVALPCIMVICSILLWSQYALAVSAFTTVGYEALLVCHSISHQIFGICFCYLEGCTFALHEFALSILIIAIKSCIIVIFWLWLKKLLLVTKSWNQFRVMFRTMAMFLGLELSFHCFYLIAQCLYCLVICVHKLIVHYTHFFLYLYNSRFLMSLQSRTLFYLAVIQLDYLFVLIVSVIQVYINENSDCLLIFYLSKKLW